MNKKCRVGVLMIFILSLVSVNLFSQEINLSASVDRNLVGLNEAITLTVTVSGNTRNVPKPTLPSMKEFSIYSQGTSRNFSIVNGRASSSVSYTYSLVPKSTGMFTIGACKITLKGKTFSTEPIEIEVTKETKATQHSQRNTTGQHFQFPFEEEPRKTANKGNDIFIKTYVNKKTVYVGEEVILIFKLYSNANMLSQPQYSPPEAKDFWKEDMGKEKRLTEIVNGKQYETVELRYALFPLTTGKLTIGEAKLDCVVDNFLQDPFSFGFSNGVKKHLVSKTITVNVIPLPSPLPSDFSGAVGSFKIDASLDKDSTKQNEPLTILITISGNGNLRNVEAPRVSIPGFRTYDSGAQVTSRESRGALVEKKIFKTMLIPTRAGEFGVPILSFTFFDPRKIKYITLTAEVPKFKVLPGESIAGTEKIFGKESVELLGKDIHFIKTPERFKNQANWLADLKFLFMTNGLVFAAFFWVLVSEGVKERMKSNKDILKKRGAYRNALKTIQQAKKKAERGKIREGYELLHKAILQFFADKFNLSVWGTTEDEIRRCLREKGMASDILGEVSVLLEVCNRARYSKETLDGDKISADIKKTLEILGRVRL